MLTKAQNPESAEHTQVVDFLRKCNQQAAATRASAPPPRPKPKREPRGPLLTNIAEPHEPPKYVGTPRPSESLPWPRRVPTLAAESCGYPFVRYVKPPPQVLNQMVRRNRELWMSRIRNIISVEEELTPQYLIEDKWDELMDREMVRAGLIKENRSRVPDEETFVWSAMQSKLWYEWRVENMWQHWTARGDAMQKLVQEERALVAKEKGGQGADDLTTLAGNDFQKPETRTPTHQSRKEDLKANLMPVKQAMPALGSAMLIKEELAKEGIPLEGVSADPFVSPVWPRLLHKSERRMKRWLAQARGNDKGHARDSDDFSNIIRAQVKTV